MTLNYSTTVPVARTVGEIQDILARAGADAVGTRYENRRPVGVSFMLDTPAGVVAAAVLIYLVVYFAL